MSQLNDAQPLLPAEPWYRSEVQVRAVIAIAAQLLSIILRMVGRYTEVSITSDMIDAVFADITQGVAVVFGLMAVTKRGNTSVAPLTLTAGRADTRNAQNPSILGADPTKTAAGSKQGGFVHPLMLALLLALVVPLVMLSACQTPPHKVIETACTSGTKYSVERCVKGIAETWETYQVRAEIVVADPLTPADVKTGVQRAEAVSRPVVVDTLKAGAVYADIKQQVAAGATTAEQLAIANENLEQWVAKALPLIRSFGAKLER